MAKVLQLCHQLQSLKKRSMSVVDFSLKIEEIGDGLVLAGQTIAETELLGCLLNGLGCEYDLVVTVISS